MKLLFSWFLRGLVLAVPLVFTGATCWYVFTLIDGWLGLAIPGAGFAIIVVSITVIGFVGSTFIWKRIEARVEAILDRLPFVRLLYASTRDLLNAVVGEKRRFDAPVLVALTEDGAVRSFGFITQRSLAALGLADDVTVYFPQSYNFAGQLLVVPAARVTPIDAPSSDVLAFIVSGGVTDVPQPRAARPAAKAPAVVKPVQPDAGA